MIIHKYNTIKFILKKFIFLVIKPIMVTPKKIAILKLKVNIAEEVIAYE